MDLVRLKIRVSSIRHDCAMQIAKGEDEKAMANTPPYEVVQCPYISQKPEKVKTQKREGHRV